MELILASQSPRRKELLGLFKIPFTVRCADIDESMDAAKAPFDEVARVSRAKAEAIAREEDDVVIAADTIVVCDGQVLGKPADEADALRMLPVYSRRQPLRALHVPARICDKARDDISRVLRLHRRVAPPDEIEMYAVDGIPPLYLVD